MNMRRSMLLICTLCALSFEAYPQKPTRKQSIVKQTWESCKQECMDLAQDYQDLTTAIEKVFSEIAAQQATFKEQFKTKFAEQCLKAKVFKFVELLQLKSRLEEVEKLLTRVITCMINEFNENVASTTLGSEKQINNEDAEQLADLLKTTLCDALTKLYATNDISQSVNKLMDTATMYLKQLISATLTKAEIAKLTDFLTSPLGNKLKNNPDLVINALKATLSSDGQATVDELIEQIKQKCNN